MGFPGKKGDGGDGTNRFSDREAVFKDLDGQAAGPASVDQGRTQAAHGQPPCRAAVRKT